MALIVLFIWQFIILYLDHIPESVKVIRFRTCLPDLKKLWCRISSPDLKYIFKNKLTGSYKKDQISGYLSVRDLTIAFASSIPASFFLITVAIASAILSISSVFMPLVVCKPLLAAYDSGIYIHTGVGFGVARFDRQGDARASECGTSNR